MREFLKEAIPPLAFVLLLYVAAAIFIPLILWLSLMVSHVLGLF